MRGHFITLEGGEGVGKSTQARMLVAALEAAGHNPLLTREPGGTPGAEAIRALLLDPAQHFGPASETLLFAAARADHVAEAIEPALAAGRWVVCDRFLDSTRAYQGGEGGLTDTDICTLHAIGSRGLLPDLTLLLSAEPAQVAERLAARDGDSSDRIGGRPADYHRAVAARFAALAAMEPERFRVIDATSGPEEVHARIIAAVEALT